MRHISVPDVSKKAPPPFNAAFVGPDGVSISPIWQDFLSVFFLKTVAELEQQVSDLATTVAALANEVRRNGISASSTIPTAILQQTNNGASVTVKMIAHRRRYDDGLEVLVNEQSVNVPYSTLAGFYYVDAARAGGNVALLWNTDTKVTRANYANGQHLLGVITTMSATTTGGSIADGTVTAAGSWVNPVNAGLVDGQFATQVIAAATTSVDSLIVAAFGLAIPVTATIKGIEVKVTRYASDLGVEDVLLSLRKAGVTIGTNKAATGVSWPLVNVEGVYGGPLDMWGTTWTPAQVNAANFGVEFNAKNVNVAARTALVDAITAVVYYEDANTTPPPPSGGIVPPGWPSDAPIP